MLKMLVIDDEIVILQGILKIIKKGNTPFTHIQSALDVDEAFLVIEQFQPDLIITDINMPGKNGLELIKKVREKNICNRFIILTGYDEFEYAHQAIRMQVIDYLLKPIDKWELWSLLRKIANEILDEKENQNQKDVSSYCDHVVKVKNFIKENYQEDLYLEKFSDITNLHPNYISSLFKKEIGVSLIQYVQDYRIEKAKELLMKHLNMSIHLISSQVGYENPQHFIKVFKKNVGMTPGLFRDNHRKLLELHSHKI